MPKSLTETLDDPDFRKLKPEVQKAVLGKMGVGNQMQAKLLAKIAQPAQAQTTPAVAPSVPGSFLERASKRGGEQVKGALVDIPENLIHTFGSDQSDVDWRKQHAGDKSEMGDFVHDAMTPFGEGTLSRVAGAVTAGPRILAHQIGQMYEDYKKDPANLVGDIAAGTVIGAATEG